MDDILCMLKPKMAQSFNEKIMKNGEKNKL